ncbi:nuclear transport factor 2 family protein [Moraxella sp. FZLJ2107]|uniref:nuclear transport factor 2 family protein n=1 Tax=unclassified Moraxella TaxID=2685852 RepID=UPI0020C8B695|nr:MULTISPECIES: nuclear transport factor 2 family protein [unclassified Moraxella]UTO05507.1 nuclear transport factor 2 family protein [Moraxella sp. FZLJ2107]UTO22243.1 nuclear transport factor 2 family protein [Moraxella sp. FZLJ2109]
MKQSTRQFLKQTVNASLLTAAIGSLSKLSGKNLGKGLGLGVFITALGAQSLISTPAYAMSERDVTSFAATMRTAANSQNIGQISKLIADDAIISLSRNNKTTSLNKDGYLQMLQKSWAKATNYRYQISISDVVITGNQARAQVITTETWTQAGKPVTIKTSSRATLSQLDGNTVLLRSVAQVTVD